MSAEVEPSFSSKKLKCMGEGLINGIQNENYSFIEFLIAQKGADPNFIFPEQGISPMHIISGYSESEFSVNVLMLFLRNHGDPNLLSCDFMTPVLTSAFWGRTKLLSVLLDFGGDPFIIDEEGYNAFDYSLLHQDTETFTILKSSLVRKIGINVNRQSTMLPRQQSHWQPLFKEIGSNIKKILIEQSHKTDMNISIASFQEKEQNILATFSEDEEIYFTCRESNDTNSVCSNSRKALSASYSSLELRNNLFEKGFSAGPITKTTKKTYIHLLHKLKCRDIVEADYSSEISEPLQSTLGEKFEILLQKWSEMEKLVVNEFSKKSSWEGGSEKVFFNYLLLDPQKTKNLSDTCKKFPSQKNWKEFLDSIFYIGKGKHSRPYSHFYEALKSKSEEKNVKRIQYIHSLWTMGLGVVCIHVFHCCINAEALTREAAMIDALYKGNLTNERREKYHGSINSWSRKEKCQLGSVLLYKAFRVYLAEGERQIYPCDLRC